nr:hypothetical protein [Tanacetum cinerariifolium]
MARLAFCDYHNMIAILEKYDHNVDFHTIVDFVEASYIRRNLKLNDEAGISSLPDAELFENLTLMGYNISPNQKFTFQKATNRVYNFSKMIFDGMVRNVNNKVSKFLMYPRVNSPSFLGWPVPLFDTMLVHQGEGSGTPTKPHHTPSLKAHQSPQHDLSSLIHPHVTTETIPTGTPTDTPPFRQYSRRARIASPLGDDSQGEAFPTVSGLEAGHDRANIIKSSTLPHDSTPRVTSLDADGGSMQQQLNELTDLYTRLQRIKLLEDKDGGVAEPSREDAIIKGRSLETWEEAAVEKITKKGRVQVVSVPPTAEVSTVSVPTDSGMVPTASLIFTTASVVTHYSRRKGKEKMVELDTPKKKKLQEQIDVQVAREMEEQIAREDHRMNEQIARDAEVARIHAEEELQMLINRLDRNNETIAKYLQEYEQFAADLSIGERIELINDLGMSLEEIREKFIPVWKQIEDFIPMGSKEEGDRVKRKGLRLKQESTKKVKISEEVSEEDLKTMMQLVPVEEVYVEALQETLSIRQAASDKEKELWVELKRLFEPDVKDQLWTHTQALMHDPVEWRLYDSCGVHYVLSKDQESFMLVEKDYPLRKALVIVMISNKLQVENYSQMDSDLIQKIYKIANSPRQRDD